MSSKLCFWIEIQILPMSAQSRCHDGKLLFHRTKVMLCVLYVQSKLAYIVWPMLSRLTDRKHNADLCRTFESIAQWVLDPVLAFIPAGQEEFQFDFLFDDSFICSYLTTVSTTCTVWSWPNQWKHSTQVSFRTANPSGEARHDNNSC